MRVYAMGRTLSFTNSRVLSAISQGGIPGPEGSIGKLVVAQLLRETGDIACHILGPEAMLQGDVSGLVLGAPGMRIAGGTDEVMRNIIGERVLGLPGEPRVDKGMPFREAVRTPA
jgi:alkylation response protein AidB-like acyl-CoA dehydrogenase